MPINTIQEEGTQGVSNIQGPSGQLVHADTGEYGPAVWDHTPCPGGLVVCQAATLTAAAAGSPLYSEGYEILLLNKLVYRNTQCFRR